MYGSIRKSVSVRLGSLIGPIITHYNCFQVDGYSAYFSRRSSAEKLRGRRVVIYDHHDIVCQPVTCEASSETINVCAVTVGCNDGPLLIVSVYRSPKATYEDT